MNFDTEPAGVASPKLSGIRPVILGGGDGWVVDRFEKTVRMSTYLLAFIVSDFGKPAMDQFSVWSRKSVIDTTAYALEVGPKILSFYETFFKVKYPLPKTDMVAIPDFSAGAMENWGLITYRETALLYDTRYSSASNMQRVATVISHELAHQNDQYDCDEEMSSLATIVAEKLGPSLLPSDYTSGFPSYHGIISCASFK
ncbi:Aminopeptidase N [Araneus ventricosus]|uniref:Aminopeptidase N n=1 Tax=Araneus ventricosus TaxID=182803 RepID=A0A4Y2UKU9_ARAVE|nr:Aminopeptidase N [Araneus ventricosus]